MADAQPPMDLVLVDAVAVEGIRHGRSVLVQAAFQGHEQVLRYLLQRISSGSHLPPTPNQRDLNKALSAAFLVAAEQGHSHCVLALLDPRASPNTSALILATNEREENALMLAAKAGRGECIRTLLQHNLEAQVLARSKQGRTALMLAAYNGHAECISRLLQYSPHIQVAAASRYGNTALMTAALRGHGECVRQLLQHIPETQVAAANLFGNTALMTAARSGHADCISKLLQHSPEAQVAAVDGERKTALLSAVSTNHPDCVALLLAHSPSAQIDSVDGGGLSVVEVASRLGHAQCLDPILAYSLQAQHLDAAWLSALRHWDATHARTSPHTRCLERLHAKGALLPVNAPEADRAKNRLFFQDVGSRALVADRANEAIVGLAMRVRVKKQKV